MVTAVLAGGARTPFGRLLGGLSSLTAQTGWLGEADVVVADGDAFATVVLASGRALGLSAADVDARVNVNGGAISLGHPIGASGAQLVLTLAAELIRRGGGTGVAALCGGRGQGDALLTAPGSAG